MTTVCGPELLLGVSAYFVRTYRDGGDPVRIAREALRAARRTVPRYSGRRGRRDYTQPQLLAILLLRRCLGLDFRRTQRLLREDPAVRRALRLRRVPHYSTLCYAQARLGDGGHPLP